MKSKVNRPCELPFLEQLTAELYREKYKRRYKRVLRSTIYTLIVVAAVAVLVATIWMPVLQIYGASMAPTLDEPYLTEKALGDCDIALPYQVPDNRYFCMGDHRSISVDSRSTTIGGVSDEQIVGKIVFRVWPLSDFGTLR